ncbi:hypothetical protein [Saccharothrix xinjiangensis]|uniref:Integral membrane protein n=1 Tax=Saccharothrix xinjiangensis TaxID=204798 RepID=A0ABV9Y3R2_9PSEU
MTGLKGLWWWLCRRRVGVGPGDVALDYARGQVRTSLVLAGVVVVEAVAVGLLVRWPWLHVLDAVALVSVLSAAAGLVVHPHVVGHDALLLRDGGRFAVRVPLDAITSVRAHWRSHTGKPRHVDDGELVLSVGNQTDVHLELSRPLRVRRPDGLVTRISFRAEDPDTAVTAIGAARTRFGRSSSTIVR